MPAIRIHQFHSGSAVGDAITNGMFLIRSALRGRGIESDIFVEGRDPRLVKEIKLLGQLDIAPDDILLIHHSMGHDVLPYFSNIECKKILVYHNITPPKFFQGSRVWQKYSLKGHDQIAQLAKLVSATIADSDYNADDLHRRGFANVAAIPLLKDFKSVRNHPFEQSHQHFEKPAYHLLFVGRIAGNKGQIELVEFMAAYADSFDYPLHLTLVGHSDHDGSGYGGRIRDLIAEYGLDERVHLVGHVSDEDLYGLYRAADAYVSASQHEGFGVPLVEAMAFDLPIVAYDAAAVASTLGGSGVLIQDTRPETIARALAPVLMSRDVRRRIVAGQRHRLEDFDIDRLTQDLFDFLAPFMPGEESPPPQREVADPVASNGRNYVVQGPCETSYSLAIVNRCLAIGLDHHEDALVQVVPMEGFGGYPFDAEQAKAFPELKRLLSPGAATGAETVVTIRNTYPPRPAGMQGDFRLMNFFWEETEVPRATIELMERHLDGVLVASTFGRAILRNSGLSIPIGIIGCGIDHHSVPEHLPERSLEKKAPFRFLHVSSGLARKGIEELFTAYVAAFTSADAVELVIKTYDNETNVVRSFYEALIGHRPNAPVVHVITGSLLDADMQALYASADAVVLPTRGEGFNLPAAEAMISGTPVLVTGFSAHMDFCDDGTAWMIEYDFEPSQSHLRTGNSNWVRARAIQLAAVMRKLFARSPEIAAERDKKRVTAFKTASSMTWAQSARKTNDFVDTLMTDAPSKPKLKVAWISTWNTRCGIASYSEFLVPNLSSQATDVTIFANHENPNTPDPDNVIRSWNMSIETDSIAELSVRIVNEGFDAVVFQHNFGFFSLRALSEAVTYLGSKGIDTYVFFHRTELLVANGNSHSIGTIAEALKSATRLVVHGVDDVNRLKSYGLVDNVVQLPHGLPVAPAFEPTMVKRFLGMRETFPLIASYGFLLPHKGISELIVAFGLLRSDYPNARLLLLNSQYPAPSSAEEARLCRELIADLGLESDVLLITDYMNNEDVTLMLHAADVIVYPYQHTEESSSAAVRAGLAALRPVAVTPLPIFKDVADYCYTLPGTSALDIAEGLRKLIADPERRDALVANQKVWLDEVNWEQVGKRFSRLMIGLHNDARSVRVVPERQEPQPSRPPARAVESPDLLSQLSDEPFVRLACQRILGRDPQGAEQAAIKELRDGRLTRTAFIASLTGQAEANAGSPGVVQTEVVTFDDIGPEDHKAFVEALYSRILKRGGDPGGVKNYVDSLTAGRVTRASLINTFMSSDEFFDNDRAITVGGRWAPTAESDLEATAGLATA